MKKIYMNKQIQTVISLMISEYGDYINRMRFKDGYKPLIMFHTADIWMSEFQLSCFKKFLEKINEKEFIITQIESLSSQSREIPMYEVNSDISYEDYYNLPLYDMSVSISKNSNWILCIEEGIDYGTGIIAVKDELIDIFKCCYPNYANDTNKYIEEIASFGAEIKEQDELMELLKKSL